MRLAGIELYASDLARTRDFYERVLGLELSEDVANHHVLFDTGAAFLCLERPGVEDYPSREKAVVFLEVSDLAAAVETIGRERFLRVESRWAVLPDPDGHSVILTQK